MPKDGREQINPSNHNLCEKATAIKGQFSIRVDSYVPWHVVHNRGRSVKDLERQSKSIGMREDEKEMNRRLHHFTREILRVCIRSV